MDPSTSFAICNYGVLPAWALLALAPRWSWTQRIVHGIWIPLLLALVYTVSFWSGPSMAAGGFGSLAGVMQLFDVPEFVLMGWVHYLVFDLFIGAWQVRDAGRRGIHHALVVPCLFFTLMAGPFGLALYLILRLVRTGSLSLDEEGTA